MTTRKATKRALLMSFLSILLCASMLIGTTYAWFTDSVTSAGNIIKSGTLDVTMEWKDATATGAQQSYKDASAGAMFNYDKWEPGYVEAKNIKIANVGTLALKYQLNILATGTVSELADVIDVYFADEELTLANRDMTGMTLLGTLREFIDGMPAKANGQLAAKTGRTVTIGTTSSANDKSLLLYRDSFGDGLMPYLSANLGRVLYDAEFPYNYASMAAEDPDAVVIELVERNIPNLLLKAPAMPAPLTQCRGQLTGSLSAAMTSFEVFLSAFFPRNMDPFLSVPSG